MNFWSKKDYLKNVLVIHIDSGSVGTALIHKGKNSVPEIVHKKRISFSHPNSLVEKSTEDSMIKALNKGISHCLEKDTVKEVFVVMSSPWSTSDEKLASRIKEEILHISGVSHKIVFEEFMPIYFKVFSSLFQNLESSLLVNVSNQITEVLFVENGTPKIFTTLPVGPISAIKQAEDKLNVHFHLSESSLKLFALGNLDPQTKQEFDIVINEMKQGWGSVWHEKADKIINLMKDSCPVFVISPVKYESFSKLFIEAILPNKKIILLGHDNKFTHKIARFKERETVDECLAIIGYYVTI